MQISYRQGLISAQSNFLQIGQNDTRYVDLILSQMPIIAAIADGERDYLVGEYKSVPNAWGPFTDSKTYYLYWEINPVGKIIRGATSLSPESGDVAPPAVVGQMWWDTTSSVYKVYDGQRWVKTLRVFAGTLQSGGILVAEPFVSQENLSTQVNAGFILTDGFGGTFRDSAGNFLTTDTPLSSNETGSLVKMDGVQVLALANENIPKFTLVYLVDGRAAIASGDPVNSASKAPIGIVMFDAYQNDAVEIITSGKTVFNQQWDWPLSTWGKPVYCSPLGTITPNKPPASKNVRVGTILNAQSILLNFDWETDALASGAITGLSGIAATYPLQLSGATSYPTITLPPASATTDGFITQADWNRIPALELALSTKANLVHTHSIADVIGLQLVLDSKASISHIHLISEVTGLQAALDGKSNVDHTHVIADILDLPPALSSITTALGDKIPKVVGITGNFPRILPSGFLEDSSFSAISFALANHLHIISEVTGLQVALDGKAALVHDHTIAEVTGLQLILDGKAALVHTHAIADVIGLQTALDGKSSVGHTHVIADVAGLQLILDNKSPLIHVHAISDVTGLQSALDGKAALVHTHVAKDITDFDVAVKAQVFADLSPGTNITLVPDSSGSTLIISSDIYSALKSDLVAGANITLTPDDVTETIQIDVDIPPQSLSWPIVSPQGAMIESNFMTYNGNPGSGALTLRGMAGSSVILAVGGNYVNDPGPSASLALTSSGEIKINGQVGVMGQVLASSGPLMAAHWIDLPAATVAAGQVVVGTGAGVSSSSNFEYDSVAGGLSVNATASTATTPGNVVIGASYDSGYLNGTSNVTGTISLMVNNNQAIYIDPWGDVYFNQLLPGSDYQPSTYLFSSNGVTGGQTRGNDFNIIAGNPEQNSFNRSGGNINLYGGSSANWMSEGASLTVGAGGSSNGQADNGGDVNLWSGWAGWYDQTTHPEITDNSRKSGDVYIGSSNVWTGTTSSEGSIVWKTGNVVISTGSGNGVDPAQMGTIQFAPGNVTRFVFGVNGEFAIANGNTQSVGTAGQVFTSAGAGVPPVWANPTAPQLVTIFTGTASFNAGSSTTTWASPTFLTANPPITYDGEAFFSLPRSGIYKLRISSKLSFVNPAIVDWPGLIAFGFKFNGNDTFSTTIDTTVNIRDGNNTALSGIYSGQNHTWVDEFIISGSGTFAVAAYTDIGNQTGLSALTSIVSSTFVLEQVQ